MKHSIITLILIHFTFLAFAQEMNIQEIGYDISPTYRKSIIKEKLSAVKTIKDINPGYPSSWINNYISVEISATANGSLVNTKSVNDILTTEQISLLEKADIGTDIIVNVQHSSSSSSKADTKQINFVFTIVPKMEASFPGGNQLLKQYLKENAIDKLPDSIANQLQQASVRFWVNEDGRAINAQISKTSTDEETDHLLLEVINKMPKWIPAENSKGIKVKQEFEFSVGNFIGC